MALPNWVGKGLRWPLTTNGSGGIATASREDLIEQSMRIIIGTAPGDYVLWPDFGCRAHERVFDPASPDTIGLLIADVREALLRWEPRIDVIKVTGDRHPTKHNRIDLSIHYVIRSTRDERIMTYPFYMEGGETA